MNEIANWMIARGFATGHGDSVADLLTELEWQIRERERDACAKVCEEMWLSGGNAAECADAIIERGEK